MFYMLQVPCCYMLHLSSFLCIVDECTAVCHCICMCLLAVLASVWVMLCEVIYIDWVSDYLLRSVSSASLTFILNCFCLYISGS